MSEVQNIDLSIVIPTYGREQVLLDTLGALMRMNPGAAEIVVVDQTPLHQGDVQEQLERWNETGAIRWVHQSTPSIPAAMNRGLLEARNEVVLFLDDDIIPSKDLVARHLENYGDEDIWAIVGQILQPGQVPEESVPPSYPGPGLWSDLNFPFNGTHRRQIYNCMAGNLSVRRQMAIAVGGMDMNFKGVAYRFETEFARRLTDAGGKVMFDPLASLRHLQAPSGGTRTYGNHLTSGSPVHGVGEYYMAYRSSAGWQRWKYQSGRMWRSISTRFHLRHPWWIPVKLAGEARALMWAARLHRQGPRYMSQDKPLT